MGSTINPLYQNFVGGMNPTGANISIPGLPQTSQPGSNPLLPNVNLSPNSAGSSNPYDVVPAGSPTTPTTPGFSANTGGGYSSSLNLGSPGGTPPGGPTNAGQAAASPFSFLNSMTPTDISRMYSSLKSTYGDGMAHQILDFMTSGAGFNQQAINNLLATLQPGIERGTESLMSQFSASGNRFGSGAQIGLGDYLSQVNLNEGQLVTQMYEDSLNKFMEVMMGTGGAVAQNKASSPSVWDRILGAIGLGGSAAGGASAAITAGNPNANTSILDTIAGAATGF
jgi:hypothetical protein